MSSRRSEKFQRPRSGMLHHRCYGIVLPQSDSFAGALASVFRIIDAAGLAPALPFRFDDALGGAACLRILDRFPALAPFVGVFRR